MIITLCSLYNVTIVFYNIIYECLDVEIVDDLT